MLHTQRRKVETSRQNLDQSFLYYDGKQIKSHLLLALKFMLLYFSGTIRSTTFSLLIHETNYVRNKF